MKIKDTGYIDSDTRYKVLKRDGHRCRYCGKINVPFEIDHVYPHSKGGETTINNLVTACVECNHKKLARVGMWPKPIGYFENRFSDMLDRLDSTIGLFSLLFLFIGLLASATWKYNLNISFILFCIDMTMILTFSAVLNKLEEK